MPSPDRPRHLYEYGLTGVPKDYVKAYMLFHSPARRASKDATRLRDEIGRVMRASDIAQAEKLVAAGSQGSGGIAGRDPRPRRVLFRSVPERSMRCRQIRRRPPRPAQRRQAEQAVQRLEPDQLSSKGGALPSRRIVR